MESGGYSKAQRGSHARKGFFFNFNKLKRGISKRNFNFSAVAEATFDQLVRQRVTEVLLDGAPHWPRTVLWLISFLNKKVFHILWNFQFKILVAQAVVNFMKLDIDDLVQVFFFKGMKDQDFIDAVLSADIAMPDNR